MPSAHIRWINRAALLLLAITLLALVLIASGLFDPAPLGSQLWARELPQMSVPSNTREIQWIGEEVPQSPATIRLTAARQSGEQDIGYGLVVGDETAYLAVAVSPLGYLAVWETANQDVTTDDSYLLEWQTWPHVHTDSEDNEIWLDIDGNRANLRINREWLWEGEIRGGTNHIGLLGESFGDTAAVDFETVELFSGASE
ncbi:MAG: hypothetical protein JSV68_17975 [Anaerolineaceae bacterium]|nr:MAG: hypothetical protein JSV68_17975 [Anaerolineaceae bacterium]